MIEELDLSKVHLLKEIPDNFISENCKIETLFIPAGVKIVGDGFASSKSIREVYVPYTVEKIGTLNDDEYAPDVYIYTNKLTDIESLCALYKNSVCTRRVICLLRRASKEGWRCKCTSS